MKPILLIDFDGTLCHDRYWRSIDKDSFGKIQNFLFGENKLMVNEWVCGVHSSENINRLISKELNIPFEKVWDIFVADCKVCQKNKNSGLVRSFLVACGRLLRAHPGRVLLFWLGTHFSTPSGCEGLIQVKGCLSFLRQSVFGHTLRSKNRQNFLDSRLQDGGEY